MDTVKRFPAAEEYKRNPELRKQDVEHLIDWYLKQPHFPKYVDEEVVIQFLHSNYYRLEPAKTTIENFLTARTHMPEFFSNRDPLGPKDLREMMSTLMILPLKQKTPEGYGVVYARMINLDPSRFHYSVGMRLFNMISELWLLREGTMNGNVIVIDIKGILMTHALRLPPLGIKKYLFYLQEAIPIRIKGLYFVNTTSVMDFILSLMKPFLKKELMDVLYMHPSFESLSKQIPLEILPNEAGGKAGPQDELYAEVLRDLEQHRDFFLAEEAFRVDESKRPGKPKSATDLFGVEGSFKKLDID